MLEQEFTYRPFIIAAVVGGIGTIIGIYWLKKNYHNLHKKKCINEKVRQFQKELKCILAQNPEMNNQRTIKSTFELLFKISMQKMVYQNILSKQKRRNIIRGMVLVEGQVLQRYLRVIVEEFMTSKVKASQFMNQQIQKFGIDKQVLLKNANTEQFKRFKNNLRRNCLNDLEGLEGLNISELNKLLDREIAFLYKYGQQFLVNNIMKAVKNWPDSLKNELLKTFSLIILDFTLQQLRYEPFLDLQKLKNTDQMDIQYAKKKYMDELSIEAKIMELQRKSQNYKQALEFSIRLGQKVSINDLKISDSHKQHIFK